MIRTSWSVVALGLALAALCSCDSTSKKTERGDPPANADRRERDEVDTVVVPRLCVEQMEEFLAREQLLLADRVEIDASSDPFFAVVSVVTDPAAVEKTEAIDPVKRMSILRLRNKTGQATLESVLPRIRVGNGFEVVATQEILVRFHKPIRASRPIYFDLGAAGDVFYSDSHRGEPVRGERLAIELEVRQEGSGYMFASRVKTPPAD